MAKLLILPAVAAAILLSGCAQQPEQPTQLRQFTQAYSKPDSSRFAYDIAAQLVHHANSNLQLTHVGVTTFSQVTSDYNESTPFAQALAQQLMTELHRAKVQVLDFKTTDFIRVTAAGDFALTRDYLELDEILPITHVVVGTWAQQRQGILVSARLVDINSKDVVSVAQTYIPEVVVRQLSEQGDKALIRKAP